MKIYFDGDSFTYGKRLVDPLKSRFSKLVADHLGAEECNYSIGGASNQRIQRQLFIDHKIEEYDLAIIQMTFRSRCEYYDQTKRKFTLVNNALVRKYEGQKKFITEAHRPFWKEYYEQIYNDRFGRLQERIIHTTIRDHCKVKGVPLILMTNDETSTCQYDYSMAWKTFPKDMITNDSHLPGGHPNEAGHMLICKHILDIVSDLYN